MKNTASMEARGSAPRVLPQFRAGIVCIRNILPGGRCGQQKGHFSDHYRPAPASRREVSCIDRNIRKLHAQRERAWPELGRARAEALSADGERREYTERTYAAGWSFYFVEQDDRSLPGDGCEMQGEPGARFDKERALHNRIRVMQAHFRRDAAYEEADEIKKDIKRLDQQLHSHRVYRSQLIARTGGGTRELTS